MPTEKELINERLRKLDELRKLGIDPYPYNYDVKHYAKELSERYKKLKAHSITKDKVKVSGRIVGLRRMGKASFVNVMDASGKIQAYFKFDNLKEKYNVLKLLDIGDWIGVEGTIFKTKTGELTIDVKKYDLLCKSTRPFPEKWHGLKDIETRYRKRYLDLIMNPEIKEVFVKRTRIIDAIREFLNKKGFLEVDTPVLQPIYGGANARPFKTHLNALSMDVYLRISNELYLKKLIVGGFDKIYEFSKDFRNEDIDRTHNPEFLQVEIYQAFADFEDMRRLTEDIFIEASKKIIGNTKFVYQENKIDLKRPWKAYTMNEAIKRFANIDVAKMDDKEMFNLRFSHQLEIEGEITRGKIVQALFESLVEEKLIQPTFITHHPKETTPLCKISKKHPQCVERFEPFIMGMEVGNAYSELNDPIVQRELLEEQARHLRAGQKEAHPMDEEFLQSIEYGMPPTGGLGIGIDRLAMLLTNQPSIREVIFFPFMKGK